MRAAEKALALFQRRFPAEQGFWRVNRPHGVLEVLPWGGGREPACPGLRVTAAI